MKKNVVLYIIIFVVVLFLLFTFPFFLLGSNAYEFVEDDNFVYGHTKIPNRYFVDTYLWDGNINNMDIYIPEKYNGKKIKKIGGYYGRGVPHPFKISLPLEDDEINFMTDCEDMFQDDEYITYSFTIHVGRNIKEIFNSAYIDYYGYEKDGKVDIKYKIEYRFVIDKNNKWLGSENGRIYEK